MPEINPQRLLDDLHRLRSFGAVGNGVVRTALSGIDLESRDWLRNRFSDAGLETAIDSVGNVIGLSKNEGPAVLIGSHSDTQPEGGWLDGAYGVICALEVARAFSEDENAGKLAVDVASWMDEEGTYLGCLGSLSYCELLKDADLDGAMAADGSMLKDALRESGLAGNSPGIVDLSRQVAYLEAHIEQGPVLDTHEEKIGVVTGIVGIRECAITFVGQQNHAGTTPMKLRKDAATTLIALASAINSRFPGAASDVSVWTIGTIKLSPNSPSIVPGSAELMLQFRDPDNAVLDRMEALALQIVDDHNGHNGVHVEVKTGERLEPARMDETLQSCIAMSAEKHASGQWRRMPSGAVHDAQVLSARLPAGMVFVPSLGGISHSFAEDTDEKDLVLGCQVLSDAAYNVLLEYRK